MAGLTFGQSNLKHYVCSANDVINIKLVRSEEDLEDEKTSFKPEFTHQLFGENESIFGYQDLLVKLYYTASKLTTYLGIEYSEKVDPVRHGGVQADNVTKIIADKLQAGFCTSLDDFVAQLPKEVNFSPYGEMLYQYTLKQDGQERSFEVYKADINNPGFHSYHERLQTFVLWYIDAASFIDSDDERWHYYLLFERYQQNGSTKSALVGYATVYLYYAYPNRIRPRIGQMLIMPPFQKQGHGEVLLQSIYKDYIGRKDVLDITVEDPSENFQRLRDYVDAKNCIKLKSFQPDHLYEGFSYDMAFEARQKLNINKKQARRIYEILRLNATNEAQVDLFRKYRLDIKKRLNIPYQKQKSDMAKLSKVLSPDELSLNFLSNDQRLMHLEEQFQELMSDYRHIVQRLSIS